MSRRSNKIYIKFGVPFVFFFGPCFRFLDFLDSLNSSSLEQSLSSWSVLPASLSELDEDIKMGEEGGGEVAGAVNIGLSSVSCVSPERDTESGAIEAVGVVATDELRD